MTAALAGSKDISNATAERGSTSLAAGAMRIFCADQAESKPCQNYPRWKPSLRTCGSGP